MAPVAADQVDTGRKREAVFSFQTQPVGFGLAGLGSGSVHIDILYPGSDAIAIAMFKKIHGFFVEEIELFPGYSIAATPET